jgi:hypothetical protein
MAVGEQVELRPSTQLRGSSATPAPAATTDQPRPPLRLRLDDRYSPPPPYVDAYLDSSSFDDDPLAYAGGDSAPPQGRRSLSVDTRRSRAAPRSGGRVVEQALQLRATRETLAWGQFQLDAGYADRRADQPQGLLFPQEAEEGFRLSLTQDAVPMPRGWQLRQSLGDLRTRVPSLLGQSSRVSLPSSIVRGYSAELAQEGAAVQLSLGRLARFEGVDGASVAVEEGSLASIGWRLALSPAWSSALSFGSLRGNPQLGDRQSLAVGLGYLAPAGDRRVQFNLLQVENQSGAWISAQTRSLDWEQDFGVYRLPRGLTWLDNFIGDDRQGLHWRGQYRQPRWTLNIGTEAVESNLARAPDRGGRRLYAGLATLSGRVGATVTAGVSGRGRWQTPLPGMEGLRGGSQGLSLFTSFSNALGQTRLQLAQDEESRVFGGERQRRLIWDQGWPGVGAAQLNTTAALEQVDRGGDRELRLSGGLNLRGQLGPVQLFANAGVTEFNRSLADEDAGLRSRARSGQLSASWSMGRHWQASLSYSKSAFSTPETSLLAPPRDDDSRVLMSLAYGANWGRSAQALGTPGDGGVGGLSGEVFVDDTGDGERQPGERGVAGVPVFLDGFEAARTDEDGRFELWPVYSGRHAVRIAAEDLPLPLTPAAPGVIAVEVPVRGYGYVAIPVVDLQP